MKDDENEIEQKYQAFLQRSQEEMQKKLAETVAESRKQEITEELQRIMRKNLLDKFHIDMQISGEEIVLNKKLRYLFALEFMKQHWSAAVKARLRLRDLL